MYNDSFLGSFMRKSSRRGYLKTIVTDQGTNFVGVAR